jgi:hypothetical protein
MLTTNTHILHEEYEGCCKQNQLWIAQQMTNSCRAV